MKPPCILRVESPMGMSMSGSPVEWLMDGEDWIPRRQEEWEIDELDKRVVLINKFQSKDLC